MHKLPFLYLVLLPVALARKTDDNHKGEQTKHGKIDAHVPKSSDFRGDSPYPLGRLDVYDRSLGSRRLEQAKQPNHNGFNLGFFR